MSVSNGQKANAATFNAAFVSKTTDSTTTARLGLNRTGSGAAITDVQQKINDIETNTSANATNLSNHISDSTAAHAASAVSNTPSGNLAATDVQAALNELQGDVDGRIANSLLTTKGDLIARDTTGPVRIGVGTNGQVLTADSTQTAGVKWADATGGGGSGVGGINYISNYDAETDTTGWAVYADAAGAQPVDGTGGTANITWTRTTSTPLRGNGSFLLTKDAVNRQGQGASFAFTIADADKATMQQINFEYEVASGTYATGDLAVYIYDVTNAVVIQPSAFNIENVGIESKARLTFQTASNSNSYRLCFHVASVSALAYSLKFDSITLGPQVVPLGAPVTDWVSYTPTGSWVTNTTYTGRWRRVGDTAEIQVRLSLSGAPTAATLTVNLPSGLVIDTTKLSNGTNQVALPNSWGSMRDDASYNGNLVAFYDSTTSVGLRTSTPASPHIMTQINATTPVTWAINDSLDITYRVPIVGWSSSTVVSSSADTRVVAGSNGKTSAQAITATTYGTAQKVTYNTTPLLDTHGMWDSSNNRWVIKVPGRYRITAPLAYAANTNEIQGLALLRQNGSDIHQAYLTKSASTNSNVAAVTLEAIVDALSGDYFEIFTYHPAPVTSIDILANSSVSQVRFMIEMLQGPSQIAASEVIAVSVPNGAATGTVNGSFNNVTFSGTEVVDTHGAFDGTTFTAPAPGLYDVYSRIELTAVSTSVGASEYIAIYKNGSLFTADVLRRASTSFTAVTVSVKGLVPLNAGDAITIRSSSGSITPSLSNALVGSSLTIKRLGGVM